jgi:hypothetical protein
MLATRFTEICLFPELESYDLLATGSMQLADT